MAFRPRSQAEKELADFLPLFVEAVTNAHRLFWKRGDVHILDPGTRTRAIRDYVVHQLRRVMDGKARTHISSENQTTLFCIGQNWIVQVHKLDEGNEIAKNFTQISMDLRQNRVRQETLPGVPPKATVLFLGYVLNISDPKCPDMRLSCPGMADESWVIPLGVAAPERPEDITPADPADMPDEGTKVVVNNSSADRKAKQ